MKEFHPKISIIIPVYNGNNYLKEAIDSALGQTYNNIEIILVNDGSNDNGKTEKICKSYKDKIKYYFKENGGAASALNYGISKMQGEYFSWLSHDDVYFPNKIESEINLLRKIKNKKTIIYSGLEIVDANGKHIEYKDYKSIYNKKDLNKPLFAFFHLALNGCSMLIHKDHFNNVGMFNPGLPTTQDYDLWFRLLRGNQICYDENILVKSRSHEGQDSKAYVDTHIEECNEFWLRIFSSVEEQEIIETFGSKKKFYTDLYHSFKSLTFYDRVIAYLFEQIVNIHIREIFNEKGQEKKKELIKDISCDIFGNRISSSDIINKIINYGPKQKPRIVFFTLNWHDRGGLNRVISRVSSLLSETFDVFVVCMKEKGNENGYELGKQVEFLELTWSKEFNKISELLKILDIDVFISSNNCYIPLIHMYKNFENLGIKVIMWNHEHYFVPYYEDYINDVTLVRGDIFKEVSVVLWLTEFSARIGRMFCDRNGIMPNPISFTNTSGTKRRKKNLNIISIARFDSERKHLDRLLIVFAKVIKSIPNAKLFIVGPYNLEMACPDNKKIKISDLMKKLKIPKGNLIFTGEIKNVQKYYQKSSINVMTSEREGFGLTILESAVFGIPSVVFGGGGMSDIITDGRDGFVIKDGNIDEMARTIIVLLQNEVLYSKMSKAVLLMSNKYKEESIKNNWELLINNVINLKKEDLAKFLKKNFNKNENKISPQDFKDVALLYEGAIKNKIEAILQIKEELNEKQYFIEKTKNSLSWKITFPLRKLERLFELYKLQGFWITNRKIILKILKMVKLIS